MLVQWAEPVAMISCRMRCSSRAAFASLIVPTFILCGCSLALDFDATSKDSSAGSGGNGSGGGSGAFCAQHMAPPAVFCDDFDSKPLGTVWPGVTATNGSATDDPGAAFSTPNSMLSVANGVAAGGSVRAVSTLSFPSYSNATKGYDLRTSFELRVDQFDSNSGAKNIAFSYLFGPDNDFNQIVMNLVSTGTAVSIQVAENSQVFGASTSDYQLYGPFIPKPATGEWMKVELDLDVVAPSGSGNGLHVKLNEQDTFDTTLKFALKGGTPRLELGVGWVDSTVATQIWKVRYDDFLVEAMSL